ncbi:MAG TPA: hypothetical protein VD997_03640 [Phycisphaerales bacterium]|nr:hypothetical protein [Phycisphaerales bacterium]
MSASPYPVPPGTLILHDGGMASLLVCGVCREAALLGAGEKGTPAAVGAVLFASAPSRGRAAAVLRQCEQLGIPVHDQPPVSFEVPLPQREAHELLHATHGAASLGYERVLWPASGALGDSIDLDRVAAIADRALLIGRLVALDARTPGGHNVPGIHIEAPYADFTDRQIADLVCDMELPVDTCWFWHAGEHDAEAERERRRWESALGAVGWTRG